ncbi:MAG TPA: NAD(P)-dependent oxidoreductase [Streptosporangiaceae bacterium]|nr:NAD(P)-dependent oxidoreductase [Streptosporangiaceae bacterium]
MSEPLTVAVIGTGRMGAAMAAKLREAGAEVVLYNRTADKAHQLAAETGARVAASAAQAASSAPVVLVSLADDRAVAETYQGPDGIAAGARAGVRRGSSPLAKTAGTVIADTSTVDPRTVAEMTRLLAGSGARLLDAPVSGSVPSVLSGTLVVLAGGDAADLEVARPVFDVFAKKVFHVGPSGSGAVMKLAVNTLVHALNQALSESLVLAEKAGIDRSVAYDVISASAAGAPFVQYKRAAFERPEETAVAFTLALVAKDLGLALDLARRSGVELPQATTNSHTAKTAIEAGLGQRDMSALAELFRNAPVS